MLREQQHGSSCKVNWAGTSGADYSGFPGWRSDQSPLCVNCSQGWNDTHLPWAVETHQASTWAQQYKIKASVSRTFTVSLRERTKVLFTTCLNSQAFLLWGSTSFPPRLCITTPVTLAWGKISHPLILLNYRQVRIKLLFFLFPKKVEVGNKEMQITASSFRVLCPCGATAAGLSWLMES